MTKMSNSIHETSANLKDETKLVQDACSKLVNYFNEIRTPGALTQANGLKSPAELRKVYQEAGVALSLEDGSPHSHDDIMKAIDLTLENSVRTDALEFHNQLYGRSEAPGLVGQYVTSTVGGATHTFEVAPVFTVMERECLDKIIKVAGFPQNSDGLFVPGGSMGNMYSLHLARWKKMGERVKKEGLYNMKPLAVFVSSQAHYSYSKGMSFLGMGTDNCIKVQVDEKGAMIPAALEEAILKAVQDGKEPLMVGATAGSTVFGSYDNYPQIRKICDKNNLWMHIDGCWGAPALMSTKLEIKALVEGFETADSFTWNPHKFMSVPMQCAVFVSRHENILEDCNAQRAAYLFQKDKENTEMDMGDKTVICGRNPDACKLWFAWKMTGDKGWSERVDKGIDLARDMADYAINGENFQGKFQLVADVSFTNICFWYVPKSLSHLDPSKVKKGTEEWEALHKVAAGIKKVLQERGLAMIGFQSVPLDKSDDEAYPNFFRMVVSGVAQLTASVLRKELDDIARIGEELYNDEIASQSTIASGCPSRQTSSRQTE